MLVERVSYQINWKKFKAGWSFFVPCLHPPSARQVILKETKRLKIKVVTKVVIEGGVQGIRVWRT
jgi:hypothetical protein